MTIAATTFGEYEGRRVDQFVLRSETGVEVDLISWGVVVRDWRVPVGGILRSMVLGFETFAPYPAHSPHFGAIAGRVANRIKGGAFELDGRTYKLPANEGDLCLHGGPEGLGRQVWTGEPDSVANSVRFTHVSPDGAMGFPGEVLFEAVYTLRGNKLTLRLSGMPDRPTPISLVQHQYFNLGTGNTVLDHSLEMKAGARTELGPDLVPTGAILPVAGTRYDFRTPRNFCDEAGEPIDYDLNYVLDTDRDISEPAAIVTAPDKELTLQLRTDRPGLQLYNGVWTDCPVPGLGGKRYGKHSGLCLEDQMFPDALHNPHFPNIICTPERPYSHWCEIEIA